jgi:hypothetical protein
MVAQQSLKMRNFHSLIIWILALFCVSGCRDDSKVGQYPFLGEAFLGLRKVEISEAPKWLVGGRLFVGVDSLSGDSALGLVAIVDLSRTLRNQYEGKVSCAVEAFEGGHRVWGQRLFFETNDGIEVLCSRVIVRREWLSMIVIGSSGQLNPSIQFKVVLEECDR